VAVLTRDEIIKEINKGNIRIEPFSDDMVGPGSVDLTLGNTFRTFKKMHEIYDVTDNANFSDITEVVEIGDGERFVLLPQETILGITKEKITLPPFLCGWLEGRSRFARLGLMVHITAGFMQPGINNHQVLEISNVSSVPLALHPGTRICQFIFERTIGEAIYKGIFAKQDHP
jgi:dCTP deaminase